MLRRHLFLLTSAIAFAAACSSDSTGNGGNNGDNNGNNQYNTATGVMTATIDGASWTANYQTRVTLTNGALSITGTSYNGNVLQERVLTMAIINVVADSTYTLYSPGDGHGGNAITTLGGSNQWFTASSGGSGSVTITTLDATHAVGSFSFVAIGAGSIGNTTVTNGHFDIPF